MRLTLLTLMLSLAGAPVYAAPALNPQPFGLWVAKLRMQAEAEGIEPHVVQDALDGALPLPRVIELDRKQPESTLTLAQYLANTVNDRRVREGKRLLAENREILSRIERRSGVPASIIVALWGVETDYGSNTGGFGTIPALVTLAYDGRRADYFRTELLKAMRVMQEEKLPVSALRGSWAGAMGQCQFMPSSFLQFAIDENGDGRRDIWNTRADIFASIANYLQSSGWNAREGWGRPVEFEDGLEPALTDIKVVKTVNQWRELGVMDAGGRHLPPSDADASVILVGRDGQGEPYLVYGNYKVLLQWNRSRLFATAVGTLADRIAR